MEEIENQTVPTTETEVAAPQETEADRNWKVMREREKAADDRAQAAERRLGELENLVQQQAKPPEPVPEYSPLDDDSFVDGRAAKAQEQRIRAEIVKQKQENDKQQRDNKQFQDKMSETMAFQRLSGDHSDFDKVVNDDTLTKLSKVSPSAYRSIVANPDLFDRGKTAYEMITMYGIVKKEDVVDRKLEANKNKPRTANTMAPQTSETPLSRLGDYDRRVLSEDRMEQVRRNVAAAKEFS